MAYVLTSAISFFQAGMFTVLPVVRACVVQAVTSNRVDPVDPVRATWDAVPVVDTDTELRAAIVILRPLLSPSAMVHPELPRSTWANM
jgi:hypothetical protein